MAEYKKLTTIRTDALKSTADQFRKEVDALKKAKGDKAKIAELEKRYAVAAAAAAKNATADLKIAATGFKTMAKFVEDLNGTASKRLVAAREGLAKFKKTSDVAALRPCQNLKRDIEAMASNSGDEVDRFAASWNPYRTANIGVEDKLLKEFNALRKGIIDNTIIVCTKVNKMMAMLAEAGSLDAAGASASQDFPATAENKLREAIALQRSVEDTVKALYSKNDPRTISNGKNQIDTWVKGEFGSFTNQLEVRRSLYKALTATGQASNTTLSALRRTITNGRALFSPKDLKDPKIAQVIAAVDKQFADFEAETKLGLKDLTEIAKLMTQADQRANRGA